MKSIYQIGVYIFITLNSCFAQQNNADSLPIWKEKQYIKAGLRGKSIKEFTEFKNLQHYKDNGVSLIGGEEKGNLEVHFFWFHYTNNIVIKLYPEFNGDSILLKNKNIKENHLDLKPFYDCKIHHTEMVLIGIDFCGKNPATKSTVGYSKQFGDSLKQKSKIYENKNLNEILQDDSFGRYFGISTRSDYIGNKISLHYCNYLIVDIQLNIPLKAAEYRYSPIYSRNIPCTPDIDALMNYPIARIKVWDLQP